MELARALLKKIVILIPTIIIITILFIFLRFVLRALGLSEVIGKQFSSFKNTDFLPPPGSVGIKGGKAPTPSSVSNRPSMEELNPNAWMYDESYSNSTRINTGSGNGTYTYNDTNMIYTQANPEIRNIGIFRNWNIISGAILTGEGRASFMPSGKFLIHLLDKNNTVIMNTTGYAQVQIVAEAFVPWKAQVGYVPIGSAPCTLVLENIVSNPRLSKVISIPVPCK